MDRIRIVVGWGSLLLLALAGCTPAPPAQTEFMANLDGVEMSSRELRIRLYAYATDFAGDVEHTADTIHWASDDPRVRENAILWKLHAVPALHNQIFVEDPLVGAINAYAFCGLMTQYFSEEGAGAQDFGRYQDLARATADTALQRIDDLLLMVKSDAQSDTFRASVAEYVAENPLRDLSFGRQSTMGYMAPYLSAIGPSGLAATGAMNEQMRVLNDRMALYAEFAPKHVRWQTELMMERFPDLADEQRAALMEDIRAEAIAAWEEIDALVAEQREAMMADVSRERQAIMGGIAGERQAVTDALANERAIVLEALQAERQAILASIESIVVETLATLERSTQHTTGAALETTFGHLKIVLVMVFLGLVLLLVLAWFLARNLINHARRSES